MWLGSHDIRLWAILSFQVEGAFDVGSQILSKSSAEAGTAHLPPWVPIHSHSSNFPITFEQGRLFQKNFQLHPDLGAVVATISLALRAFLRTEDSLWYKQN